MKYMRAMMETIELEVEDVVLTSSSGCTTECAADCATECLTDDTPDCPRELI